MSEIIFLIIGLLIGWLSKVPWLLWHYKHLEHTREVTRRYAQRYTDLNKEG